MLASGRKVSVPWARTGKLLTVTTDLAMASAVMEIASGLKACPRRARNWTTSTLCRFERGWENVETLRVFLLGWDRSQLCCLRHQRHRGRRCWGDRGVRNVGPSQDRIHWVIMLGPGLTPCTALPFDVCSDLTLEEQNIVGRGGVFHMFHQPTQYQYYLEIIFINCTTPWYFILYLRSYLYMEVRLSLEYSRWTKIILIFVRRIFKHCLEANLKCKLLSDKHWVNLRFNLRHLAQKVNVNINTKKKYKRKSLNVSILSRRLLY